MTLLPLQHIVPSLYYKINPHLTRKRRKKHLFSYSYGYHSTNPTHKMYPHHTRKQTSVVDHSLFSHFFLFLWNLLNGTTHWTVTRLSASLFTNNRLLPRRELTAASCPAGNHDHEPNTYTFLGIETNSATLEGKLQRKKRIK
jgi:hypothetical protein